MEKISIKIDWEKQTAEQVSIHFRLSDSHEDNEAFVVERDDKGGMAIGGTHLSDAEKTKATSLVFAIDALKGCLPESPVKATTFRGKTVGEEPSLFRIILDDDPKPRAELLYGSPAQPFRRQFEIDESNGLLDKVAVTACMATIAAAQDLVEALLEDEPETKQE